MLGKIAPEYKNIEIRIAEGLIIKSLAESSSRSIDKVKALYGEIGDIGDLAIKLRKDMNLLKNPKPNTLSKINTNVWQMAKLTGSGSQKDKQKIFKDMFVSCD